MAEALHEQGVRFVAMRCAGFDKVDVGKLNELGIKVPPATCHVLQTCREPIPHSRRSAKSKCCLQVARVPTYSPESVAEHSVTLAMALNRFVHHLLN